jgi:hypothetical protein
VNLDRYKEDLDKLVVQGERLYLALIIETVPSTAKQLNITEEVRKGLPSVRKEYQIWYSEALAAIGQLMPDRVEDFIGYYKLLKPRKEFNASTYKISDYLQGINVTQGARQIVGLDAAVPPLEQQVQIVKALTQRFQSSLFDIRAIAQADLFDNELDAADELNRKGFHRGAGAIAGVVLEGHLATVCEQHKISKPKNPSISDLNEILKKNDILDIPTWRFVQHLADLRNLCDHKKSDDPTKEQIHELIEGVRKIIKTVF